MIVTIRAMTCAHPVVEKAVVVGNRCMFRTGPPGPIVEAPKVACQTRCAEPSRLGQAEWARAASLSRSFRPELVLERGSLRGLLKSRRRGERDAKAPALLSLRMPVSRRPTRRFLSEGLPPRRRQGQPCPRVVPWHGPIVVWGGRISDGRLLGNLPNWPSASRVRSTREAPAAGADPAPLQDASGSTPHGQDVFLIFLYRCIVKRDPVRTASRVPGPVRR